MGKKTGRPRGRPKGSKNKQNIGLLLAKREGVTPLEYLLSVMDDSDNDQHVRMDAAKSAAPYCHARLAAIEANVTGDSSIGIYELTATERSARIAALLDAAATKRTG